MARYLNARDRLLEKINKDLEVFRGLPMPVGITKKQGGTNLCVLSQDATAVTLLVFIAGEKKPVAEYLLDSFYNKTGDFWHAYVREVDPAIRLGYRVYGFGKRSHPKVVYELTGDEVSLA